MWCKLMDINSHLLVRLSSRPRKICNYEIHVPRVGGGESKISKFAVLSTCDRLCDVAAVIGKFAASPSVTITHCFAQVDICFTGQGLPGD